MNMYSMVGKGSKKDIRKRMSKFFLSVPVIGKKGICTLLNSIVLYLHEMNFYGQLDYHTSDILREKIMLFSNQEIC